MEDNNRNIKAGSKLNKFNHLDVTELWSGNEKRSDPICLWNTNEDSKIFKARELKKIDIGSAVVLENKEKFRSFKDQKYYLRPQVGMLYGMAASALVAPSFTAVVKVSDTGISFGVPAVFDVVMNQDSKLPTIHSILGMAESSNHYIEMLKESLRSHSNWFTFWKYSAYAFLFFGFVRAIDRVCQDDNRLLPDGINRPVTVLGKASLVCCVLTVLYFSYLY